MLETQPKTQAPVHPQVRPGHIHLKVSDLERSMAFYREVLGFELVQNSRGRVAFMSAGGYHHHIALNTWESLGGPPPAEGHAGILHIAFTYPSRKDLAIAYKRLLDHGVEVSVVAGPRRHRGDLFQRSRRHRHRDFLGLPRGALGLP